MTIQLMAAAAEAPRGWANTFGILAGLVGIYFVWRADAWYRARQEKKPPSPTEAGAPAPREITQAGRVSSQVSPDGTASAGRGETSDGHWYGSIQKVGGTVKRVYRDARHIAATGDSPAPRPQAYGDPVGKADVPDDVIDIPLVEDGPAPGEVIEPADDVEPDDGPPFVVREARRETRTEYIERCLGEGVEKAALVQALQRHYGRSRAQAYRDVDTATAGRRAA